MGASNATAGKEVAGPGTTELLQAVVERSHLSHGVAFIADRFVTTTVIVFMGTASVSKSSNSVRLQSEQTRNCANANTGLIGVAKAFYSRSEEMCREFAHASRFNRLAPVAGSECRLENEGVPTAPSRILQKHTYADYYLKRVRIQMRDE
jgi:hypothetical protein